MRTKNGLGYSSIYCDKCGKHMQKYGNNVTIKMKYSDMRLKNCSSRENSKGFKFIDLCDDCMMKFFNMIYNLNFCDKDAYINAIRTFNKNKKFIEEKENEEN